MKLLLSLLGLISGGLIVSAHVEVDVDVTPAEVRHGWAGGDVDVVAEAGPAPVFALDQASSSEGAVVKHWHAVMAITGGKHLPTYHQEVGDCVANGAAAAVNYLQFNQFARGPPAAPVTVRLAHRPFIYGVSRTAEDLGNKRLRGDGSVGAWAAHAVQQYGVLAADDRGVPEYSGELSRQWGAKGVPEQFYWQASLFKVRTVARVQSYEDVRDALANGYPVTIASNVGFQMKPVVAGGKHWGRASGTWAHQMCLIGVDDKAVSPFTSQPGACYCLNSWGANAHGTPADDAPPGGFWIDRTTVERIVGQGDSWAFSNFDGFPVREQDFVIFDSAAGSDVGVEIPEERPPARPLCRQMGLSPQHADGIGVPALALSLGLLVARLRRRRWWGGDEVSQSA